MKVLVTMSLLLLALAACSNAGSSVITSSIPVGSPPGSAMSASPGSASQGTPIVVKDFTLDPKNLTVKGTVTLAVTNEGPTIHNISIRDASGTVVGATKDLNSGESETLSVEIPAGSYTMFCSLPGHESLGIRGALTVAK